MCENYIRCGGGDETENNRRNKHMEAKKLKKNHVRGINNASIASLRISAVLGAIIGNLANEKYYGVLLKAFLEAFMCNKPCQLSRVSK